VICLSLDLKKLCNTSDIINIIKYMITLLTLTSTVSFGVSDLSIKMTLSFVSLKQVLIRIFKCVLQKLASTWTRLFGLYLLQILFLRIYRKNF